MRKLNSKFRTNFISEAGTLLQNKDFFAFVELDEYACYVIADGIDEDLQLESAKFAIACIIRNFTEKPSISRRYLKNLIKEANEVLISESNNVRLKASLTIVVTDYAKVVYAVAGNTRFYLFRDEVLKYKSKDQSLTQLLNEKEEMPLDKIAKHIERNNLYCYLGQNKLANPYISRKIKLMDGDIFVLLSKGIWENVDEQEIAEAIEGAEEPKAMADNVEDVLLSKQLATIDNYTFSVTFVDKIYIKPENKAWIKKALIAAIPIAIVAIVLIVVWLIARNNKINSINQMNTHKTDGIQFTQYGNITKANDEYKAALDIANKYKLKKDIKDLDNYHKLTETILDADAKLKENKYEEALDKYLVAVDKSKDVNNIATDYIAKELNIVKNSMKVTDLLAAGDKNMDLGNLQGAEDAYKQAKDLAIDYYLKDEKKDADAKLDKLTAKKAADADKAKAADDKKQKEDDDKKKADADKQKTQDDSQAKAIESTKKGDLSYSTGDYVNAKMNYLMAQQLYTQAGIDSASNDLVAKIQLMDQKIKENSDKTSQADQYVNDGNDKYISGDANSAKILYLLAKDIYDKAGNVDASKKVQEKIDLIDKAAAAAAAASKAQAADANAAASGNSAATK